MYLRTAGLAGELDFRLLGCSWLLLIRWRRDEGADGTSQRDYNLPGGNFRGIMREYGYPLGLSCLSYHLADHILAAIGIGTYHIVTLL